MADWRQIKKDFAVDQLIGLYIKVNKDVDVTFNPIIGTDEPAGKIKAGQVAGRVYSWVDDSPPYLNSPGLDVDGLYIMFERQVYSQNRPYYMKVSKGLIDWNHLKNQLDEQRKSNMNYYEGMLDQIDTYLTETQQAISDSLTTAAYWGIGILTTWFVWENVLKPMIYLRTAKSTARDLIKEFKS